MKNILFLILIASLAFSSQAQKIKLQDGDLKFLKGVKDLGVEFTYDNLTVGKMTEEEYIAKKVADANEHEPGSGENWPNLWYGDRTDHYEPKFIE